MELQSEPGRAAVESYILTRGAERAWRELNSAASAGRGAFYWIGGAPGAGKTHFLNYALALERRSSAATEAHGRRITCAVAVTAATAAEEIQPILLAKLAKELTGESRAPLMWLEMDRDTAWKVALEHARRLGVGAVTIAIDFGESDASAAAPTVAALARAAGESRSPALQVLAAGRGQAPREAQAFDVGCADAEETARVAIARARRIDHDGMAAASEAYADTGTDGFDAQDIYPFHPTAVRMLVSIAGRPATVAAVSWLAREALRECAAGLGRERAAGKLIYPADLMRSRICAAGALEKLGGAAREALGIARNALSSFDTRERELASAIVDTLALRRVHAGASSLAIDELFRLLPAFAGETRSDASARAFLEGVIGKLADATRGVVALDDGKVRFEPSAAEAPQIAAYNAALLLVRMFAPELTAVHSAAELRSSLARLGDAMAQALEECARTGEALRAEFAGAVGRLPDEEERALSDYAELAEGGAGRLLAIAADAERASAARGAIAAYEALAQVAATIPKLRAMREYLEGTRLGTRPDGASAKDREIARLETDRQLIAAQLGARSLAGLRAGLDALEARFARFRAAYAQRYRAAHAEYRREMKRAASMLGDLRLHFDALTRLNAIAALGPRESEDLAGALAASRDKVVRCDARSDPKAEVEPLCPRCGFVLGTEAPQAELAALLERIRAALSVKLAALSRSAIARLIREHGATRKLEGFLKITQAAETDALVRVLDDKLARYLAQLLDENLGAADTEQGGEPETAGAARPGATRAVRSAAAPRRRASKPARDRRGD
jgi:hypothetical protein